MRNNKRRKFKTSFFCKSSFLHFKNKCPFKVKSKGGGGGGIFSRILCIKTESVRVYEREKTTREREREREREMCVYVRERERKLRPLSKKKFMEVNKRRTR